MTSNYLHGGYIPKSSAFRVRGRGLSKDLFHIYAWKFKVRKKTQKVPNDHSDDRDSVRTQHISSTRLEISTSQPLMKCDFLKEKYPVSSKDSKIIYKNIKLCL